MSSDFEFRLRMRVEASSPEAIIINYLNSKQTPYPSKDMAMIALMTYWLPLACQDEERQSPESFKRTIQNSIYRLKLHVQYLQQMLGEEVVLEEIASLAPKVVDASRSGTPLENAVAQSVPDQNPNGNSIESQPAATESEGWFNPLKSNSNKHS
jgi:hypothetical protein